MNSCTNIKQLIEKIKEADCNFIVVTGGVCSSIGKGILVASLGVILKNAGYSVAVVKWDPYLNVDPGTMSPLVHGEVFITSDGAETDLDLGHYERLIQINVERDSSVSSGQIYQEVLQQERDGEFLGKCIQVVPHVVNVAKRRLLDFALKKNADFVLLEIGGTVGDMEGEFFLEAIRQLKIDIGTYRFMHAHLSYVPFLSWTGEVKTKPTQHSVMSLKKSGLIPDCLFLRADQEIDAQSIKKLSLMCDIKQDYIFQFLTEKPVFRNFISLNKQAVGQKIQHYFNKLPVQCSDLSQWSTFISNIDTSKEVVTIGLIVKYVGSNDPYISVIEAIHAAAYSLNRRVNLITIEAELLVITHHDKDRNATWQTLMSVDGIVVPGGFDARGVEGKILAAQWARENNVPYLGLCLGMQVMIIEAARNILGLMSANSTEFDSETKDPVVCIMGEQKNIMHKGASMRLGSYACRLTPNTRAYKAYQQTTIIERHRHRYEVNNVYKEAFSATDIIFSGINEELGLVEISELKNHPFMLGVQFHPEFQSSPLHVHPLFKAFIDAVIKTNNS